MIRKWPKRGHKLFVFLAEGDAITLSILTINKGKSSGRMTPVLKIYQLARNMPKLRMTPHQSSEAAGANKEERKKKKRVEGKIFKTEPARSMKGIL